MRIGSHHLPELSFLWQLKRLLFRLNGKIYGISIDDPLEEEMVWPFSLIV